MTTVQVDAFQTEVVNKILSGQDIILSAVAGSGKTTTILEACRQQKKHALILTYNARLKTETRDKIFRYGMGAYAEAHSYHAFLKRYYVHSSGMPTDDDIMKLLYFDTHPDRVFTFETLYIDEAQDIKRVYFLFILKIIQDCKHVPQLVLIGDKDQSIYDFGEDPSDYRYMSNMGIFLKEIGIDKTFESMTLTRSYRITKQTGNFIRSNLFIDDQHNRVQIHGHGTRTLVQTVEIAEMNTYEYYSVKGFMKNVLRTMRLLGLKYSDIAILSGSIKTRHGKRTPVSVFENVLAMLKVPVHLKSDYEGETSLVSQNKLLFSSYHGFKGTERELIIVLGYDTSYDAYFKRNKSHRNSLYVAMTRAKQKTWLVKHNGNNTRLLCGSDLSSVHLITYVYPENGNRRKMNRAEREGVFAPIMLSSSDESSDSEEKPSKSFYITRVTDFVDEHKLMALEAHAHCEHVNRTEGMPLKYDAIISFDNDVTFENISRFYGTCVPMWKEYIDNHKVFRDTIVRRTLVAVDMMEAVHVELIKQRDMLLEVLGNMTTVYDFMKMNVLYVGVMDGLLSVYKQIGDYNWVQPDILKHGRTRLDALLNGKKINNEVLVTKYFAGIDVNAVVSGRIDILADGVVYELKFKRMITREDIIQTATYISFKQSTFGYLYNVYNDKLYRITPDKVFMGIYTKMIREKISDDIYVDDQTFIDNTIRVIGETFDKK